MLKTELHTHIKADPQNGKLIKYSAFELIDRAAELNFQVLAITCHDFVYENEEAREYARKKGILLLAGMEKTLQGKHTLLYNLSNEEAQQIKTFTELRYYKKAHPEVLVIAPHPFHWQWTCLKDKIVEDLDKIRNINHDKDVTMHHLSEELGEIAREIFNDKTGRAKIDLENLKGEFVDVMVLISYLAQLYGIKLDDALQYKLNNFKERFNLEV